MKIKLLIILLSICGITNAQGVWNQKADFGGTVRSWAISFSIGNEGYVGTGDQGGLYQSDFWEWDQATNVWTQKADFGGGTRSEAVGFSIGTKGYFGTGDSAYVYKNDFWEWDQATNIWTQKADFGGLPRAYAVGFSIGTKGYIGTGYNNNPVGYFQDFWEWDQTTNSWTQKTDFGGTARAFAESFSIGSKGYIGIGMDVTSLRKDFWDWDQATNAWTQKADFGGTPRYYSISLSIGLNGYIGLGWDGDSLRSDFWEWNQATNIWTQKAYYEGNVRVAATSFSIGTKGYIGTGTGGATDEEFWEYGPDSIQNASANFQSALNPICPGTCASFTNLSSNATSYQWSFAGGTPDTSTALNPTVCYNTPGSYDVMLIATNANGSDTLTINNYITVYPYPPPQGIQQSGDTLFANAGALTYQWYQNGNIISGATNYFYLAQTSGDYNVVCTDNNSCEVEAAIFNVVASVQSANANLQIDIFPNPVHKELKIENVISKVQNISIWNVLGEKVYQAELRNQRSEIKIDLSFLESGIYFLKVVGEKNSCILKFVKQ